MQHRRIRHEGPAPDPGVLGAGIGGDLTSTLQLILVALDDIRTQLSAVRKTHFTTEEVAAMTGRSCYTVRTWVKKGRIRATRVDGTGARGRLLVAREELGKLLAAGLASQVPAAAID